MSDFSRETELIYSEIQTLKDSQKKAYLRPRVKNLFKRIKNLESSLEFTKTEITTDEYSKHKGMIQYLEEAAWQLNAQYKSKKTKDVLIELVENKQASSELHKANLQSGISRNSSRRCCYRLLGILAICLVVCIAFIFIELY